MNAAELKNLQAPLKEKYRDRRPESAIIKLKAREEQARNVSLKKLILRYCMVYQILINGVEIETNNIHYKHN